MLKRLLFLTIFSLLFSPSFSGEYDSLKVAFRTSKTDTSRVKVCLQISKIFEKQNFDSSFYWLNKGLAIAKKSNPAILNDSTLYYYKGVTYATIGLAYARMSTDYEIAKNKIDSSIAIFSFFLDQYKGSWLKGKSLHGLSVAYGTHGRICYSMGNLPMATYYFTKALEIQEQLQKGHGVAMMYNNLGLLHRQQANYAQSISYHQKSLDYFLQNNDSANIASVRVNIGLVSKEIGAFEISLRNFYESISYFEKTNNYQSLASAHFNIGEIFSNLSNWKESFEHIGKGMHYAEKVNDKKLIANGFLNLGNGYTLKQIPDSAMIYLKKSENIYLEIDDKIGIADVAESLGDLNARLNAFPEALKNYTKSLEINTEIGRKASALSLNINIAKVFLSQGKTYEAKKVVEKVFKNSHQFGFQAIRRDAHRLLSEIFEIQGLSKEALYHHKRYAELNDSIFSIERAAKLAQMEALFNIDQKQKAISQLEKEKAIKDYELNQAKSLILSQRFQALLSIAVLLVLLVVLLLLYRQYRIKRFSNNQLSTKISEVQQKNEEILTQKEEIENQKNELEHQKRLLKDKSEQLERFNWLLTDSIDYASSIQSALLPSPDIFQKYFSDHFIVFFPKDVVSGDSYWAYPHDNKILLALLDCTGHGVPGGFMSMMGITALTELMGRHVTEPSETLNNLRLFVIESFKQTGKVGEQQDGMDIALISYEIGSNYIEFAGANHPLWLVKANPPTPEEKLMIYKADSMPISYFPRMSPYKTTKIPVEPGDQIYLFSDGFRDQIGGVNFNTKFGKEKFKELILSNSSKTMEEQKSIFEDTFFRWVDGNDQIDDITIMGLKI
jgi:serine phosphatase RsbU (regulator of sigma subunit)